MMRSELDALRAFLDASEQILPYCNDDSADTLHWLLDGMRDRLRDDIAELRASSDAALSEHRREIHRLRLERIGLKVLKGGKR